MLSKMCVIFYCFILYVKRVKIQMLKLISVFLSFLYYLIYLLYILWEVNILNSLRRYLIAAQKGVWQSQRPIEGDENEVIYIFWKFIQYMYREEFVAVSRLHYGQWLCLFQLICPIAIYTCFFYRHICCFYRLF